MSEHSPFYYEGVNDIVSPLLFIDIVNMLFLKNLS